MTTYAIKYKRLFEVLIDPYCILSSSGVILKMNTSFANLLGKQPGDTVKKKIINFLSNDCKKLFTDNLELDKSQPYNIVLKFEHEPTKELLVTFTRDDENKQIYLSFNSLKLDHTLLQQRLRMYENIIENNWDAIVFSDLSGQILLTNRSANHLYLYDKDELIDKNIDIFLVKADGQSKQIVGSLKTCGSYTGELKHKRKDGTEFLCLLHIIMVYDDMGNPLGLVSSCRDISAKKEMQEIRQEASDTKAHLASIEETAKSNQERLRVFENIIVNNWDGIIFSDLAGKIIISNDSAARMYGYTITELEGQNIEVFNIDEPKHVKEMVTGLKEKGGWSGELKHKHKLGTTFDILLTINMIYDTSGHPMGLVSTSKDITDRVLAQFEANQKTKELIQVKDSFVEKLEEQVKQRTIQLKQEKEKSDELLLNILPQETANELKNQGYATPRYYEAVTILFTDFVDFTKISEKLNPAKLIEELNKFFSTFDDIIKEHNIEKIKTIGDAYMCASGVPTQRDCHALDMVKAAMEIQAYVKKVNLEKKMNNSPLWELRLGIHTGPVVTGVVGKSKFAYDIWGDAVNIASRIESASEPGKINISVNTYDLVKGHFACEHRGKIHAKNKGDIDMYFVQQ